MINSLDTLLLSQTKNWMKQNFWAKIVTVFFFAIFIGVLLVFIYKSTNLYLQTFPETDKFGIDLSIYVLRIIIMTMSILAVISSAIMLMRSIFENKNIAHWIVCGMKIDKIFSKYLWRSQITCLLIFLIISPILWSFNKHLIMDNYFIPKLILELSWLSLVTTYIGFGIAIGLAKITKFKINGLVLIVATIVFLTIFFNLVLPKKTSEVYKSSNYTSFNSLITSLPANNEFIISNWTVDILVGKNLVTMVASQILLLIGLHIFIKKISNDYLLSIWQKRYGRSNHKTKTNGFFPITKEWKSQMIFTDLLSFWRSKSDLSYIFFILFLTGILWFTTIKFNELEQLTSEIDSATKIIIFLSLIMISIVTSIRLLFPIAAKEKKMAWFNYSLPISRKNFLNQKLMTGTILSIIMSIVYVVFTITIKTDLFNKLWFLGIIFSNVLVINLIQILCGFIQPNFIESENEEAISTNTTGFISLMLSIIVTIPSTIFLFLVFNYGYVSQWILLSIALSLGILTVLYKIAINEVNKYNL